MPDLTCNIRDSKGDYQGSIRVHLRFNVPDEMLTMLGNMLGKAWDKWQDDIILHEQLEDGKAKKNSHNKKSHNSGTGV